ncbi:MAG: O-antigen ligase family protein [Chloroflexi bacterium]|nr:O-antigen ligase family protein [Chloroflexota bacterium]
MTVFRTLAAPRPRGAELALIPIVIAAGLAIGALPLTWAAAAGLGVAALVVGLLRPVWFLAAAALAVPFGTLVPLGVGSLGAGGVELALAAAALSWAIRTFTFGTPVRLPAVLIPLGLWTAFAALSVTVALNQRDALKETFKWAELGLAVLLSANLAGNRTGRRILLAAILTAGAAEAALGAYQFFTRTGPDGFLIGERFLRAYGTFGQPNPFAGYLALILPLLLALALGKPGAPAPSWRLRSLLAAAGTLMLAAVGMSLSRGAWIALAGAVAVVLALHSGTGRRILGVSFLAALLVAVFGAVGALPPELLSRLEIVTQYLQLFDARHVTLTPQNFALVERMAIWQAAAAMSSDHPVLGVGIGNFDAFYLAYALRGWLDLPGHAHNVYLTLLAETGVIGLAVYCAAYLALAVSVLRAWRRALRPDAPADAYPWAVGALGMLAALTLHNLLDSLYVHGIPVHLGLVLGATLAPFSAAAVARLNEG